MNRAYYRKIRKQNQKDVAEIVNKYAERYNACEDKQAFINSLTAEEKREIGNTATYIKLQALSKYASLSQRKREALQQGDISIL